MKVSRKSINLALLLALSLNVNGKKHDLHKEDIFALEWFDTTKLDENNFLRHNHSDPSIKQPVIAKVFSIRSPPFPDDPKFVANISGKNISCLYVYFSIDLPAWNTLCKTEVSYNGLVTPIRVICPDACKLYSRGHTKPLNKVTTKSPLCPDDQKFVTRINEKKYFV